MRWFSDSPSRASSVVCQAFLVCVGTCGARPSQPQVPLPGISKARQCAWTRGSWSNGRPKHGSANGAGSFSPNRLAGWSLVKGRGGPCQPGADKPQLPQELRGQQRCSRSWRLQLTTLVLPPNTSYHEITAIGVEAETQLQVT